MKLQIANWKLKIAAAILVCFFVASAHADYVDFYLTNYQASAATHTPIKILPVNLNSNGTYVVSGLPTTIRLTNGVATNQKFLPGDYQLKYEAPGGFSLLTTNFFFTVTDDTTNRYNVLDLRAAPSANGLAYTKSQADSRFVRSTNGNAYSLTASNVTLKGTSAAVSNYVWTAYDSTGLGFWKAQSTGTNGGTVTSVGITAPSIFSVSGSPVTESGTLAISLASQSANLVFAGPTNGSAAAPTFRALISDDIPVLPQYVGTNQFATNLTARVAAEASLQTEIDGKVQADVVRTNFNVVKYGASPFRTNTWGDYPLPAITDSTAAIQAAVDAAAASASDFAEVYFPHGIYKITNSITNLNHVTLVGDGFARHVGYQNHDKGLSVAFTNASVIWLSNTNVSVALNFDLTSKGQCGLKQIEVNGAANPLWVGGSVLTNGNQKYLRTTDSTNFAPLGISITTSNLYGGNFVAEDCSISGFKVGVYNEVNFSHFTHVSFGYNDIGFKQTNGVPDQIFFTQCSIGGRNGQIGYWIGAGRGMVWLDPCDIDYSHFAYFNYGGDYTIIGGNSEPNTTTIRSALTTNMWYGDTNGPLIYIGQNDVKLNIIGGRYGAGNYNALIGVKTDRRAEINVDSVEFTSQTFTVVDTSGSAEDNGTSYSKILLGSQFSNGSQGYPRINAFGGDWNVVMGSSYSFFNRVGVIHVGRGQMFEPTQKYWLATDGGALWDGATNKSARLKLLGAVYPSFVEGGGHLETVLPDDRRGSDGYYARILTSDRLPGNTVYTNGVPSTNYTVQNLTARGTNYANEGVFTNGLTLNGSRITTWPAGGTGSGETNTASNLGGGYPTYDSKSSVDLRFNTFTNDATLSVSSNANLFTWGISSLWQNKILTNAANVLIVSNSVNALDTRVTDLESGAVDTNDFIAVNGGGGTNNTFTNATLKTPSVSGILTIGTVTVEDESNGGSLHISGPLVVDGSGITNIPIAGVTSLQATLDAKQTGSTTLSNLVAQTSTAINGGGITNLVSWSLSSATNVSLTFNGSFTSQTLTNTNGVTFTNISGTAGSMSFLVYSNVPVTFDTSIKWLTTKPSTATNAVISFTRYGTETRAAAKEVQ